MDYPFIEAVTALRTSSAVAAARAEKIAQEMVEAGILPPPPSPPAAKPQPSHHQSQFQASTQSHRDSIGSTTSHRNASSGAADEDEGIRTCHGCIPVSSPDCVATDPYSEMPMTPSNMSAKSFGYSPGQTS